MKKKIESKRNVSYTPYDLDIISNFEQFKFTHRGRSDGQLLESNHVFQFCLEPVGDTSTRRPGKRWQIRPICLPSNRNRGNFHASLVEKPPLSLSFSFDSFRRDNFFPPLPFPLSVQREGIRCFHRRAEPISVQITDLQIRIAVCEITNRFAATISNILRDGEIGGENRFHVRPRTDSVF